MKQTIRLTDIYNGDLFTRSKATELSGCIIPNADEVVMDFEGISFMSRSFADELYNVVEDFKDKLFEYIHRNDVVETMMTKVAEGRKRERKRGISHAKNYEFDDMESLSAFLMKH